MATVSSSVDIKTLIKLALPIGSRLVTGRIETPVSWVCQLSTRPPLFADLGGGELVLLSVNTLANYQKPLTLETVIEELTRTNASALGIRGTLSPRAHQVAKALNFPLIALPDRAALPQVERAVQRLFTNRQSQLSQRAFELQQTLQRHAAGYRGLTTMLNALARMLDRPVVVHDRRGNVLSRGLPASAGQNWDAHMALAAGAEFVRRFDLEDRNYYEDDWQTIHSPAGLTAPLIHDGQLLGYVSVLTAGDLPDDFDMLALEYSAPTFVREMVRQQVSDPIEVVAPSRDWISDWLSGAVTDDSLMTLRAEKDSYRAGLWYAVALFHWNPAHDRAAGAFSPERMVKLIQTEMHQRRIQAPIGLYVDRAVLLFPLDEPQQTQRLKQMVDLLHHALKQAAPDGEITVGVGRPVRGLNLLRESFREAERALTLSEQLKANDSQVAFFGDLSLYELLLGVNDPRTLSSFCDHWLSPLSSYDEQHHTDLLITLDAYFSNNGNMARTAHVLNIHRNTLVYRLSRITEIIQLDMDDPNVRLNLQLALKVQRMLNANAGPASFGD